MTHEAVQSKSVADPVDLRVVCILVGAFALFAPFLITLQPAYWGSWDVTIWAMTWRYHAPSRFFFYEHLQLISAIPWTVWRVVFVYQMIRYYRGISTRRRTFLLGLLAELPLTVGFYMMLLFSLLGTISWSTALTVPTPLMLLVASVFLWMTPYPVPKTPFDDQVEPDRWWKQDTESEGMTRK